MKILAICAAVILCCATGARGDEAAADLAKMNGTWDVVEYLTRGEKLPEPKQLIIENGVIKLGRGQLTITLNTEADPRHIDLKTPNRTQYNRGIYELDGDTLRISYGPSDVDPNNPDGRPKTFNTDNSYYSHVRLRRSSP